jgi:diaminohydroxyphosphoribosylaminopyrimidine deaminase/5-amino-6-(5-phosphoribosylamino)uracil reductase
VRIIIDNDLTLPQHLRIFDGSQKTIVFTLKNSNLVNEKFELVKIPIGVDKISFLLNHLYCNKILSVIVEGGAKLVGLLMERNLWDEARVFHGKALFGEGIAAPKLKSRVMSEVGIDGVRLGYYRNNR